MKFLRGSNCEAAFHDFDDYDLLIETARVFGPQSYLAVLLGGDAGLRCGEMLALEWDDVDFARRRLVVSRSDWMGHVTQPKGGRSRIVPMTARLAKALHDHRHLRSPRVLCQHDGQPLSQKMIRLLIERPARKAHVTHRGVHVLRHTFCSHLAMKGVPVRAIQELAGHSHLSTTQRYMHLSPAAIEEAIRILEQPKTVSDFGEMLETAEAEKVNP